MHANTSDSRSAKSLAARQTGQHSNVQSKCGRCLELGKLVTRTKKLGGLPQRLGVWRSTTRAVSRRAMVHVRMTLSRCSSSSERMERAQPCCCGPEAARSTPTRRTCICEQPTTAKGESSYMRLESFECQHECTAATIACLRLSNGIATVTEAHPAHNVAAFS